MQDTQPAKERRHRIRCALRAWGARIARVARDDRGAVMTEYLAITGFVGLAAIPAFAYLGYVVAHSFSFMRGYTLYMYP